MDLPTWMLVVKLATGVGFILLALKAGKDARGKEKRSASFLLWRLAWIQWGPANHSR